jgi:hypothetical protein
MNLVKVTDATTGELKRWETPNGKPVLVVENRHKLILTKLGRQQRARMQDFLEWLEQVGWQVEKE